MTVISNLFWFLFYGLIFVPVAVVYRLFISDSMRLQRKADAQSYWLDQRGKDFAPMDRET